MQNLSRKLLTLASASLIAATLAFPAAAADKMANPCAAKPANPCAKAANPCAKPAMGKMKGKAANPCAKNPCAAKPANPCAKK